MRPRARVADIKVIAPGLCGRFHVSKGGKNTLGRERKSKRMVHAQAMRRMCFLHCIVPVY